MDFSGRPTFAFADHALLEPGPAGRWHGVDGDGVAISYGQDRMEAAIELSVDAAGRGLYALPDPSRAGERCRFAPDRRNGTVVVEAEGGRSVPMRAEDFHLHAVRTDPKGKPVCSFLQPLHEQYSLCRDRPGCEAHCLDIAELAEEMRKHSQGSVAAMRDVGLYDAVSSGITDGLGFIELMARVSARSGPPVHRTSGLEEALPGQWAEIRRFPQYLMDSVRAIFGGYMEPLIGEFPLERVSRLHAPHGAPLAAIMDGIADLVATDPPFEGGNVLRGYRTSPVARYEGKGFGAIVFSDIAGTYVYAWPTQPEPQPEPRTPGL